MSGDPITPGCAPPQTLMGLLESAACAHPERGISIFDARGKRSVRRSYAEVLAGAHDRAAKLAARGLSEGDVALLSLETSWELVDAWFGAVLLGALPVVIATPTALGVGDAHLEKLSATVERLDARLFLCGEAWRREALERGFADLAEAACTDAELDALAAVEPTLPERVPEDLAFLQLTSGSTGTQRGVLISHGAVCANARAIHAAIGAAWGRDFLAENQRVVSWLPLHHDMGLVGILLASIAGGFELSLLPPRAFLARPLAWLRELSGESPVVSAAPNFAYHTCVDRYDPEALAELDLTGWHTALCGAEMVRPQTLTDFVERYRSHGLPPSAPRPCYGLAEATLAVTFDVRDQGVRTAEVPGEHGAETPREVACVGAPVLDTRVEIVDDTGRVLGEETVGEVRVAGPSLFSGYWRDEEATAECLRDGWLYTGDLGFLKDGELYITGRLKDLLILRGHNLMPHELEWCAEAASGGGGHTRSGAFSIPGGADGEEAVLAVETELSTPEELAGLSGAIRRLVADRLGLALFDLALVRRGRLPKTTSGKVQRRELRRRYLTGELDRLDGGTTMDTPR
jgi:fatty-acyl-CoA synthase